MNKQANNFCFIRLKFLNPYKKNPDRWLSLAPIGKMSKGQCIKAYTSIPINGLVTNRDGNSYYSIERNDLGGRYTAYHAGYVSTKFAKIQYR